LQPGNKAPVLGVEVKSAGLHSCPECVSNLLLCRDFGADLLAKYLDAA